jgi:HSP20 family protein
MANVARWDPYREVERVSRLMDRWIGDTPRMLRGEIDGESYFPLDLYETDNEVVVEASLPGVKPEDVDITISGDTLAIRGETKREEEEKDEKRNYYRRETWYGTVARAITLPTQIDGDKAEATFEHGVLKLRIPKAESAKPKTIKVTPEKMVEGSTTRGSRSQGGQGSGRGQMS